MNNDDLSRRALLQAIVATLGAGALPVSWTEVAQAAGQAHSAAPAAGGATLTFFSATDAADVAAVAAQIVPTDDTPGAREAAVVYFIDRALGSFLAQLASDYRAQLAEFQATIREHHAGAPSFAALSSPEQIEVLKTIERTPFFETTRLLTLFGMFSMPSYGGNRNGVGWQLIGFEDRHAFQPPFGYYDRGYPGFAADQPGKA